MVSNIASIALRCFAAHHGGLSCCEVYLSSRWSRTLPASHCIVLLCRVWLNGTDMVLSSCDFACRCTFRCAVHDGPVCVAVFNPRLGVKRAATQREISVVMYGVLDQHISAVLRHLHRHVALPSHPITAHHSYASSTAWGG